jgi:hypothetical protein
MHRIAVLVVAKKVCGVLVSGIRPHASKWQTVSDVYGAMKTKTAKQPKQSRPTVNMKDLRPRTNPKGGAGSLRDGRYQLTALAAQILEHSMPAQARPERINGNG